MLAFNFHIGDFAKKTMHLTHEERGIYLSLLMRYYDTESPLPADTESVARLVCARNADALRMVCDLLDEFFVLHDDGWHNERADQEIQKYQAKSQKARDSAKARWDGAYKQNKGEKRLADSDSECSADEMRTHSEGNANHEPQTTNLEKNTYGDDGSSHNTRLPDCPHMEILDLWAQVMPDKPQPSKTMWSGTPRAANLAARWKAGFTLKHERTGEPLYTNREDGIEWWGRFFAFLRKSEFLMGDNRWFKIDWVVKRNNFVKIMEMAYHDTEGS